MDVIAHAAHRGPGRLVQTLGFAALLCAALAGLGWLALCVGTVQLSTAEVWKILVAGDGERVARVAVLELRLPRFVLGAVSGAMLGLSGVLLQDSLRNPLAGPELMGVSAGAAAVMAVIIVFGLPVAFAAHPWLALTGGLASGSVVLLAARKLMRNTVSVVLIGAAITALLNALIVVILTLSTRSSVSLLYFFLLGSLANRTWDQVMVVLPWAAVCVPLALFSARSLNVLRLGDEVAEGLGVAVLRTRLLLVALGAALVASVVAVCGPIGWISLLSPHLARRSLGTYDARGVLPIAALLGAVLLVAADLLARQTFAPLELPAGAWTTLVGGPALLLLLRRRLGGKHP